jgi:hypothetical protein
MVAALTNGIGQAALEDMVEYAKKREAFGRPIGEYQAIQHKVADTVIELEFAKLITYKAAWLLEQGKPCHLEAAMAKLVSSEMAFKAATRGLDILAGYGTTIDYDMQRYFRDSRQCTFSPISNEMVRNFIAEQFGLQVILKIQKKGGVYEEERRKRSQRGKGAVKESSSAEKIGSFELKNRMVLAPMNETTSGVNGEATEQCIAYYGARAKGGAAMVITGAVMGTRLASEFVWGRNLYCFHQGHQQALSLLTDRIHYFGSLACAQMTIGFGRQGHSRDESLFPAPTAVFLTRLAMTGQPWSQAGYAQERTRCGFRWVR